jgi:NADH-quinone oxidoreductase subunit L
MISAASWFTLVAPLAAAGLIAVAGTGISRRGAGYLATFAVAASFAAAAVAFFAMWAQGAEERASVTTAWTWLSAGDLSVGVTLLIDPLSVMEMLIVAGVGALIVGYSIGYMDGEAEERRFFAYMALFVFSMLLLVMTGNFLLLLVGWGLVGLSSYLLIGFWHERPTAVAAAKKAFVMNAIGDATMALSLFLLIWKTGSLDLETVFGRVDQLSPTVQVLVALGLLGGAVAKSAQLPLHTWLPDAMEGPTPVSALIHAATMVTAGVYLIVRAHALFEAAPPVQALAAWLGAATLLLAGLVALVQTNVKRIIAYSTMSQIGYMFLAAGIGAYASSMFHLMTHAFFKALLFLAAGIVIHALAGEEDMRRMGGLRRLLPRTWWAFLIGALALSGLPPFAGFFSKDSILAAAWASGGDGVALYGIALAGVFLTALYTFRMVFVVWGGEPSAFAREHLHVPRRDVPGVAMAVAVGALAVLAVVGGWVQWAILYTPVETWLHPVVGDLVRPTVAEDVVTSILATLLSAAGIALAWALYSRRRIAVPRVPTLQELLERKFWFDEAYDLVFYRPAVAVSRWWTRWVEGPVVGGSIAGVAAGTRGLGRGVSAAQTGFLRTYVLAVALGAALLFLVYLAAR